ncbi:hypothetical protein A2U01_0106725, partial [Trifolium medium]|nr:hypothetical protein [Trifolium medium]
MKTPASIWTKMVRRAVAAHRTTIKLVYIAIEGFGFQRRQIWKYFLER